jgi:hypothetical protein
MATGTPSLPFDAQLQHRAKWSLREISNFLHFFLPCDFYKNGNAPYTGDQLKCSNLSHKMLIGFFLDKPAAYVALEHLPSGGLHQKGEPYWTDGPPAEDPHSAFLPQI